METAQTLIFFVNGQKVEVQNPDPRATLLQYLRQNLYLTGTKEACGQGGCGACTVMLSVYDTQLKKISHISANACLIPLCYLHGMAVTTVEGIGSTRNGLHPVQEALVTSHGMQCGFCTPGMVMSMYTLLKNNPNPTDDQLERGLEGNLCRCTGYRPIVEAFKTARKNCPCGLGLCSDQEDKGDMDVQLPPATPQDNTRMEKTQDVIFPPELQLKDQEYKKSVMFKCSTSTWHRPSTLEELLDLKSKYPSALLVMGCNSVGYQIRKGIISTENIICATNVHEMSEIDTGDQGVEIGAGVTLTRMETALRDISENVKDPRNRNLLAILDMVRWTAADQIRNTATIGGHIMSKGSNLELQTLLLAAGATLQFRSKGKETRIIPYDGDFVENLTTESSDVLISINIPYSDETEYIMGMKQPNRRGFDFGIVLASMYVRFQKSSNIAEKMRLSFGGLSSKPLIASKSSIIAENRSWADDLVSEVCDSLIEELKSDYYDDMKFRLALACSFFFRFYQQIKLNLENAVSDVSGASMLSFPPSKGMQFYDIPDAEGKGVVWKPVVNVTGDSISTGETQFVDDIPSYNSELFAVPVTSKRAHARIKSIDASKALAVKGVLMFLDHRDVPNNNNYVAEEEKDMFLFAEDEVCYFGQIIGAILAEDRDVARSAAQLVEVQYEDLEAIFTIEKAIEKNSFFKDSFTVNHGDIDKAFQDSDFVLEGDSQSGAVDHFYLEPQSAIVIPKKDQREVEVITSSQALTVVQGWIATCLALPKNRVLTKVKRCGGGFGGKFTDSIVPAGIAAVGAWKTNRPVRCVYDRVTDMNITGKRHPSKVMYKVGFNNDGKILGIDAKFFYNAGHCTDLSLSVLKIGMVIFMSGYNIANAREIGRICRTNTPSNTAFRGYGGPQAYMAMENIIQNVAYKLRIPPEKVREINLIRKGETNPFKKTMADDNLYRCWQECTEFSNYAERVAAVKEYNGCNRWKKKGLAMTPVMFPVGYPPLHMNQSGALALVYLDGSVLLAHGGVEIGQGMHTKAVQVAAHVLDIPMDKIIISETSTGTVPNTTDTGGTFSSELNAGAVATEVSSASQVWDREFKSREGQWFFSGTPTCQQHDVQDACRKLRDRLEPYKQQAPDGSWADWVNAAYLDRVSLSATGFFKTDRKMGYNWENNTGDQCQYFTFGTACTEVEIDCLTGEHQINRTDIVMDVGKSLNPAVNTGQIEGGFVQGTGMVTTEKLYLTSEGRMISSGPLNYKIPGVRSIPREFRIKLLKDSEGDKDVYSAKGIGEPPLLLSMSVYHALKAAILAARMDSGLTDNFHLPCPATVEVIRMACQDDITQKCEETVLETCKTMRITI